VIRRVAIAASVTLLGGLALAHAAAGAPRQELPALRTLQRAEAIFHRSRFAAPVDATMALRDLALVRDRLSGAARRQADALLDRPDDPGGDRNGVRYTVPSTTFCTAHFCVHYVRTTTDAPPPRDANANGVPDQVETTASVLEFLWQKEVIEYGFRPPKSDIVLPSHGPDGRVDVYLADLVDQGILGFCAPEPPPNYTLWDVPGYCVLDNDYSPVQIGAPGLGGLLELELTAVHEFFHAIQFGYDYADDTWLLEGTATWIEDEVYGPVHEPYARFPYSPLRQPQVPIDVASATTPYQYGSWVFWRFLEEYLSGNASHVNPGVIRGVWDLASGAPGAQDEYSIAAVATLLADRGVAFTTFFRDFAVRNFIPETFYREGKTWPGAPLARTTVLTATGTARGGFAIDHLASRYVGFVPGKTLPARSRLSIRLDLPSSASSPAAAAIVIRRGRRPAVRNISLSASGAGVVSVPFARGVVKRVVLVLVNASHRYTCARSEPFSCRGAPRDDDGSYRYVATANR
jgi:hypothetical protein